MQAGCAEIVEESSLVSEKSAAVALLQPVNDSAPTSYMKIFAFPSSGAAHQHRDDGTGTIIARSSPDIGHCVEIALLGRFFLGLGETFFLKNGWPKFQTQLRGQGMIDAWKLHTLVPHPVDGGLRMPELKDFNFLRSTRMAG